MTVLERFVFHAKVALGVWLDGGKSGKNKRVMEEAMEADVKRELPE